MAIFVTDKPFRGVRQMKYRKMMDECPEVIEKMSKSEVEDYLARMEQFYAERKMNLVEPCMKKLGATEELKQSDWNEYYNRVEQARLMAQEIALNEMLEAS